MGMINFCEAEAPRPGDQVEIRRIPTKEDGFQTLAKDLWWEFPVKKEGREGRGYPCQVLWRLVATSFPQTSKKAVLFSWGSKEGARACPFTNDKLAPSSILRESMVTM